MPFKTWLRISFINLLIVALLGVLMRYKIGFEFPYFHQKHIQHAHSHFAFSGWVTHTLFVLMLHVMGQYSERRQKLYKRLIALNLTCSYGMLVSFAIQGYGLFSIIFSMLGILTGYVFAAVFFKHIKTQGANNPAVHWFRAALLFNIVSTLGTFALVYLMVSKQTHQNWYLASVYFFLHFQYNGFFTFACLGLFFAKAEQFFPGYRYNRQLFNWLFIACFPAYFLSTLWAGLPGYLYVLVVLAALMQVFAWAKFLFQLRGYIKNGSRLFQQGKYLLIILVIAMSIKLLLQLGSTIPEVSHLAFGFRPIVIAYLHLVLLGIISVFLVSYIFIFKLLSFHRGAIAGLALFLSGVYLNELALAVQGIASFSYTALPHIHGLLFYISVGMAMGVIIVIWRTKGFSSRPQGADNDYT